MKLPEKVRLITVPLSPFIKQGEKKPFKSERIRPERALDLPFLIRTMKDSEVKTVLIEGKPWSVISVYSPYSPDVHVMLMETSPDRYLPGPEWIPDAEGNRLMDTWAEIIDFIVSREFNSKIYAGYNWSPRAYGEHEEKFGFQSVPTKWHPQIWGWPPLNEDTTAVKYVGWRDTDSLPMVARRILGENDYCEPLCCLILERLKASATDLLLQIFPRDQWSCNSFGINMHMKGNAATVFRTRDFFSKVIKPLADLLNRIFCELSGAMTDMNCEEFDQILNKTSFGQLSLNELSFLRKKPNLLTFKKIKKNFKDKNLPFDLLDAIIEPVRNRCEESGDPFTWWRRGFGYALVFSGGCKDDNGQLRILPGVYIGPGGVVEAQGVVLRRSEDSSITEEEVLRKSKVLWDLSDKLTAIYSVS